MVTQAQIEKGNEKGKPRRLTELKTAAKSISYKKPPIK